MMYKQYFENYYGLSHLLGPRTVCALYCHLSFLIQSGLVDLVLLSQSYTKEQNILKLMC